MRPGIWCVATRKLLVTSSITVSVVLADVPSRVVLVHEWREREEMEMVIIHDTLREFSSQFLESLRGRTLS